MSEERVGWGRLVSVRRLALLAAAGVVYFIISMMALHFLRRDLSWVTKYVSDYAVGDYGYLATLAFIALGLGALALALGIWRGVAASRTSRAGSVLIGICGACWIVVGMFRTDLEGAPATTTGSIHFAAFLFSVASLVAGILSLSRAFKKDARWRSFAPLTLAWGLAILIVFIPGSAVMGQADGLNERILIGVMVLWLLLVANRLCSVAESAGDPHSGPT